MAKQLVVSGDRILAHGEDCFLSMGGTVICPDTGKMFNNSTVTVHEGELPADIDTVGYEYHAGEFVPCAPFGAGDGNLMVACDDCKTPRYSQFPLSLLMNGGVPAAARVVQGTYVGLGSINTEECYPNTLTFDGKPLAVLLYLMDEWGSLETNDTEYHGGDTFLLMRGVTLVQRECSRATNAKYAKVAVEWGGNYVTWQHNSRSSIESVIWGEKNRTYGYLALLGGE